MVTMKTTMKYLQSGIGSFMIIIAIARMSIVDSTEFVFIAYNIIVAMIVIGFGISLLDFKKEE
jgi:hypothetical protein